MPIRRITINFTAQQPVNCRLCGYIGEHNATELLIIPPPEMTENAAVTAYVAVFTTGGKRIVSRTYGNSEEICVPIWQQLTQNPVLNVQLEAYDGDGELVAKSPMVYLALLPAARGAETETDYGSDGIAAEIAENTKSRHSHDNKAVLDKLGTNGDSLTYDGQPIKGGGGSTQGDWQQSDPAAKDYLKNRTHYETDAFEVTWDGNSEGRESIYLFDVQEDESTYSMRLVKVADDIAAPLAFEALTADDLKFDEGGNTVPGGDIVGSDFAVSKFSGGYMVAPYLVYCAADSVQVELTEFKTTVTVGRGLWYITGGGTYLKSVSFPSSVHQLEKRYIPVLEQTVITLSENKKAAIIGITDRDGKVISAVAVPTAISVPQKGVDYWTDEDKQEVVNDVIAALPSWTGGDY